VVAAVLNNVTLDDGRLVDVVLSEGRIAAIGEVGTIERPAGAETTDLAGYLLLPAAVEPHAHLDKAFLAERVANPTGDLIGAIQAMQASRHLVDVADTIERAERAARLMAANGYSAVRSHADTTVDHGLRSIEALTEVRRRVADVIDLEIVALAGSPITGAAGADVRALLVEALAAGADLVGGCPHLEPLLGGGSIEEATDTLLQIAHDHARAVDLHTDETLDPNSCGLELLARRVQEGFVHGATASHCVSLGQQDAAVQQSTAERVAAAEVSVVVLPHTNLFLQGRGQSPMPRGLTGLPALRAAGVNVAAGADNLQDPFNPVGRACPFETAGLMILAGHLLPGEAWDSVSGAAARALRRAAEVTVGGRAHLLAVRASTVREAIAFAPSDRIVWRHGRRLPNT
jgi:cytosine deaminase